MRWLLAQTATLILAGCIDQPSISVEDPWVRAAPPGSRVLAGYLTVRNRTDRTQTLLSASGPDFAQVAFHATVMEGQVARMVPRATIEVPANGSVRLQPGGLHLMLMEPRRPFEKGDRTVLLLQFSDDVSLEISAPIKRTAEEDPQSR